MKKFLGNWEIKVIAVMAAMIFWFLIVATENTFYTFPQEIPVKAFNVPENLVVAEELGTVTLRLKIDNRDVVTNLTAEDFNAYVDLEDLDAGERDITIEVSSKISDINVVKVVPSKVTVKIEQKAEKEVPIEYEIQNNPKEGYLVKEVQIESENVIIKGPENLLNDVDHAVLLLDLENLDRNVTKFFKTAILDSEGHEIEGITVDKEEIEATVMIVALTDQKIFGVQPTIVGTPSENIWIKSIVVEPNYVILSGDRDKLDEVEFVKTSDIDVGDLSSSKTFDVQVTGLPDGVNVEGSSSIKVKVEVDTYDSVDSSLQRKTVSLPILVRKFNTNQKGISINPITVTLIVEGDNKVLQKISSKLNIELDITGYEGSEAQIDISSDSLNLPEGVNIVSITPSSVKVSWE